MADLQAQNPNQGFRLWGWTLARDAEGKGKPIPVSGNVQTPTRFQPTPVSPTLEDGAINVQMGMHYGVYVDLDGSYRSEVDLLSKYRTMAMQPEMENAIDDIVNEAIVHDEDGSVVKIDLDDLDQPDNIKGKIREEFDNVLRFLDFNNFGSDIFRRWYVDGKVYYNVVIDKENPRDGIQQITYMDPRRVRKIRNITKEKDANGAEVITRVDVFYMYNEKIVNNNVQSPQIIGNFAGGIKLTEDSVVMVTSGLFDPAKSTVLSYLHKAIRPMNQLRFVEDATVIYRISRAPERRVFYIDVSNMPNKKAEQYMKDIMNAYRNKLTYDAATGEIQDVTRHYSMIEDFWMPRKSTGNATEVVTLPAGQNLGQMEDVLYFEKKLYRALGVPVSRLEPTQGFTLGKSNEITRDELKFDKFVNRLRSRFAVLFDELMGRQLALKGICTLEEWGQFKEDVKYDFIKDNNFAELKDQELWINRMNVLQLIQPFTGIYFSMKWVKENVLNFNEAEIAEMKKEMDGEEDELAKAAAKLAPPPMTPDQAGPVGENDKPLPTSDPEELNDRFSDHTREHQ
jgi:Bacteriophage T4-like portal protein (Gp20)